MGGGNDTNAKSALGMCGFITSIKTKMTPSSAMSFRNGQTDQTVDGDGAAHRNTDTILLTIRNTYFKPSFIFHLFYDIFTPITSVET